MKASVYLNDDGGPNEALLEAAVSEWVRFYEAASVDLMERGMSRWPTDRSDRTATAIDRLVVIDDESAGPVTVSIDGRDLIARGDGRSLSKFLHNVHFLASPDLFPGSLSDHVHLEHIDAPDYPISAGSLPLTIHRIWEEAKA